MDNSIFNLFESDKQAFALYLQAFATMAIGVLAWVAARGQNVLAHKKERRDLFKLRYENIYLLSNNLFEDCNKLIKKYEEVSKVKLKKQRVLEQEIIRNQFKSINEDFRNTIEANRFLIKQNDYDKLYTFCEEYIKYVNNFINDVYDDSCCHNYYIATYYNDHWEKIPKILYSYLYHENENKLSCWIYKSGKYLKNHLHLFLKDYFPAFLEALGDILLFIMIMSGMLYGLIEFIKELLKAPISIKNKRIHFEFRNKSNYLKRSRPWPL